MLRLTRLWYYFPREIKVKLSYVVDPETLQDFINLALGVFSPLDGFMNSIDYHGVVEQMVLANGEVWTIPLSLDVDYETFNVATDAKLLHLFYDGAEICYVDVEDCYEIELE